MQNCKNIHKPCDIWRPHHWKNTITVHNWMGFKVINLKMKDFQTCQFNLTIFFTMFLNIFFSLFTNSSRIENAFDVRSVLLASAPNMLNMVTTSQVRSGCLPLSHSNKGKHFPPWNTYLYKKLCRGQQLQSAWIYVTGTIVSNTDKIPQQRHPLMSTLPVLLHHSSFFIC